MKGVTAIAFAFLASFSQGIILICDFRTMTWGPIQDIDYTCTGRIENTGSLTFLEEIRGTHEEGKRNEDVVVFWDVSQKLQYIPTNLANFFPNINQLLLNSPLVQVTASDLKLFSNLIRFHAKHGIFTSIDGNLFEHNRKIRTVEFPQGKLKNVGENLLSGLSELRVAGFSNNTCIHYTAYSYQTIQDLKQMLIIQCPPLEATCSPRCSLDDEVDELKANLRETIARQEFINKKQDERLVELEMLIREIGSKPCAAV
jgi:hypothetical protein